MELRFVDGAFRIWCGRPRAHRRTIHVGSSRITVCLSRLLVSCFLVVINIIIVEVVAKDNNNRFQQFEESTTQNRLPIDHVIVDQLTGDVFASVSKSGDVHRLTGDTLRQLDVYRWSSLGGNSVVMTSLLQMMPSQTTRLLIQCVDIVDQNSECSAIDIDADAANDFGTSTRRIPVMIDVGSGLSARVNRSVSDKVIAFFANFTNEQPLLSSAESRSPMTRNFSVDNITETGKRLISFPFYVAMSDVSVESDDQNEAVASAAAFSASVSAYRFELQTNPSLTNSTSKISRSTILSSAIHYYHDGPEGQRSGVNLDGSRRKESRQFVADYHTPTSGGTAGKASNNSLWNDAKRLFLRRRKSQIGSVKYVHGFEDKFDGSVYFIGVRRRSDILVETRLSRVCEVGRDSHFRSYVELVLVCRRRSTIATTYNEAVAAFVGPLAGRTSSFSSTRSGSSTDALYVMMARSDSSSSKYPHTGYGLCVYPMSRIRQELTKAQRDCYMGTGRILSWITSSETSCVEQRRAVPSIDDSFCGLPTNVGIGSRYDLVVESSLVLDDERFRRPTSLVVVEYNNRRTAVIGSESGHVIKMVIDEWYVENQLYAVLDVGSNLIPGIGVTVQDLTLDLAHENVYAVTGSRVTRVPLKSCSVYVDCATCVSTGDPLECGWCSNHERCMTKMQCLTMAPGGSMVAKWTNDRCPPVLHSFYPRIGPTDGGTRITLFGTLFGGNSAVTSRTSASAKPTTAPTISVAVKIGTVDCAIEYRNSTCILCRTEPSLHGPVDHREVKVTVIDSSRSTAEFDIQGSSSLATDTDSFSYKNPAMKSFWPTSGIKSGGTRLTIHGVNLDIGSTRTVTVVYKPCVIISFSSEAIVCNTPPMTPSLRINHGPVSLTIDGTRLVSVESFQYEDEPKVIDVNPRRSILSGGVQINVKVTNINLVQSPRLCIRSENHTTSTVCEACSLNPLSDVMTCWSPSLPSPGLSDEPITVQLSFNMDINSGSNIIKFSASQKYLSKFTYFTDPKFATNSANKLLVYVGDTYLDIKGEYLDVAVSVDDYRVMIGTRIVCPTVQLTSNSLSCRLGKNMQNLKSEQVYVSVGRLYAPVGQLVLTNHNAEFAMLLATLPIIFFACLTVTALIIIIRKGNCRSRVGKWKTKSDISYVHVPSSVVNTSARNHAVPDLPCSITGATIPGQIEQLAIDTSLTCINDSLIQSTELWRLIHRSGVVIPRERIVMLDVIGEGNFGSVYRGLLMSNDNKTESLVAVKTSKFIAGRIGATVSMSAAEVQMFLSEALCMAKFHHGHVLHLIGVSFDVHGLPLMILPFMKHGDVLSYIRSERNNPTVRDLIDFGVQIAKGMDYLSHLKFVHRDLAARNCMLDDDMNIKVADFGLSRNIYERDYYTCDNRNNKLPVKWMSIESLEKGIFNAKTDVWSYGVVLWELLTRGVTPYPEVDNWDVVQYLATGRRLPQPSFCPAGLYDVMQSCWHPSPHLRPSFSDLVSQVASVIDVHRTRASLPSTVAYVNSPAVIPLEVVTPPVFHSPVNLPPVVSPTVSATDSYLEPGTEARWQTSNTRPASGSVTVDTRIERTSLRVTQV